MVARSASSTLGTSGAGLTVAGDFAYLARGTLGLQVVDIRHPDAPRLAGRLRDPQPGRAGDRHNNGLYVLDRVTTLQVLQGLGRIAPIRMAMASSTSSMPSPTNPRDPG